MDPEFSDVFAAFLRDAAALVGGQQLIIAALVTLLLVCCLLWIGAKLVDRKEPQLAAAFSTSIMVVLVSSVLGVTYLALLLRELCTTGIAPANATFLICAGICGAIVLATVHGAFGSAWWRTILMTVVLAGSVGVAGFLSHRLILRERLTDLPVLAAQVAGLRTESALLIKSEPLKKIAVAHGLKSERRGLGKRQEGLLKTYTALQEERARLNVADAAAVTAFNQHAAAYTAEKDYVQKRLAELDALQPPATVAPTAPIAGQ